MTLSADIVLDESPDVVHIGDESAVRLMASDRGRGSAIVTFSRMRPGRRASTSTRSDEEDRFVDLVGDEQDGLAPLLPDAHQLGLHDLAGLRIERGERLVHQQDFGIDRERAGEIDALAHAAGELARIIVLEAFKADEPQQFDACVVAAARRQRPRFPGR